MLCFICFFVLPFHHLLTSIGDHNEVDISEDISVIAGMTGVITTCVLFTSQYSKWSVFLNDVVNTSKLGHPPTFDDTRKRMNRYSKIYFWYCFNGTLVYAIAAYNETSSCKKLNEEKNLHELCGWFAPIKLPFDGNTPSIQLPIFFTQLVLASCCLAPVSTIMVIPFEVVEMLITHIDFLKINFVQVFDTEDAKARTGRLGFCVYYHNHILRLANRLNTLVKFTVGHISLISAIVFACIGNNIFKGKPIGGTIFLMGYVVALFVICQAGQRLMDETMSIGDAVYESKWYNADAKLMKDIRFIIARCQRPVSLDALPLGGLGYPLFLMIVKTAYSYLTLLNQTT